MSVQAILKEHIEFLSSNQVWPVLGSRSALRIGNHFNHSLYETSIGDIELLEVEIRNDCIGVVDSSKLVPVFNTTHNVHQMCMHDYWLTLQEIDDLCGFVNYETFSSLYTSRDFNTPDFIAGLLTSCYLTPALSNDMHASVFNSVITRLAKSYKRFGDIFVLAMSYQDGL